ncbi:MAG: hypothetical protein HC884_08730 [Chloroflexaceae bacterium]|nr:hypothetical protein [Chloroflexaceae bacterium]
MKGKEKEIIIDRPPRIQPELPSDEREIPSPPDKQEEGYARLIQVALPLITIIGYILVSTMYRGGRSIWLLIPMGLSVVASVGYSLYSYFKEKRRRAEIERGYADRLVELNKEMHVSHDMQRRFYQYNYPSSFTTLRMVHTAREEAERKARTLRSETRLWERRVSDEDFGVVRLGMGTLPSTVVYVLKNAENFEDPQVRAAMKLDKDSRSVSDIPVVISFRPPPEEDGKKADEEQEPAAEAEPTPPPRIPVTHALGIAGERPPVYEFVRALLAHYTAFHAPMDARLFILANERPAWEWIEHLPHSQDDEQGRLCCFVSQARSQKNENPFEDVEGNELEQFLESIRKILSQRKIRLQEREQNEGQGDPTRPLLLVVIDLLDTIYDPASPLHTLESDAAISILLEEGAMLGAAVIFLVPERSKVPGGCRSVIEIERTTPATNSKIEQYQKLHFRYAETGVNTPRYVGTADSIAHLDELNRMAQEMARLKIRQSFGASLATSVSFLDLMGYPSLEDLKNDTWQHWQDSILPARSGWLRVKLGKMAGNKPRTLVFSARRDGVHGMVAGSTGSGKSELLISLIVGMAVTYNPSVLNFVLVDFKGGGAFQEFQSLPHCVDIITNLASDGVTRMFTAIRSEMNRRQKLNTDTSTKNIVEYRQRGLHQSFHPYPYLFIIIDEFAEMIADHSEFKAQLETITRLGRAQGVSLILAAQRPSGVTDQMRANIKFRICLRVENPAESREMLRRTDAAYLPLGIPGRGYLQVGNEDIELIQVAYTGEKYVDPNQSPADRIRVIWPDRRGGYDAAQDQEPPELYKAIVRMLETMARDRRIEKQHAPWPGFLPTPISLSENLVAQDPSIKAITSDKYLVDVDKIMLGQEREAIISLNLSISRWLTGVNGWVEPLDWKKYAMQPVVGLIDNPYAASQHPLIVDLPRGHAVIFGSPGWGKTTFIRTLVVSLAATHSPDAFHAYLLDLGGRNLGVLEKLPHVGALIIPDEEGYKERVEQLFRVMDDIIQERKTLLNNAGLPDIYEYNHAHPASAQPALLIAIDNFLEFVETFGATSDDVESVLDKFVALVRQSRSYGIHLVISTNQPGNLPNQVYSLFTERFTLKLADPTEYRAIVGGPVPDIGEIAGRGYTKIGRQPLAFQVALPIDLQRPGAEPANEVKELELLVQTIHEDLARSGRTYRRPVRVDALPRAVLLKQLLAREHRLELDATFLERLKAITRQKWAESIEPRNADWLSVTIGVISGNRPRPFHLEAKKDGVHGMIAGGTGAGKSELLMTLIVGLALNYDPSILNFVLVDYKGGGAFKPFEALPHCVDTITNLNKAAVRRMFTAIGAEMERRQKLNTDTRTTDIVEYRARGLHLDPKWGAYPHLFLIIDEYAEMITDSPEFRDELDSITRLGRSVGINLLLASQRPVGVSDQMRANIKLRICLRVEGVDTSREMLRRTDAAFLPSGMPGRGYVQVGNEQIELMQVAYTGEKYAEARPTEGGETPKFYEVVVNLTRALWQGRRPRTPWPPFLPHPITMADPLTEKYLDQATLPLITLNDRANRLSLNPFLKDWLDGNGTWYGMDWSQTAMRAIVGLLDDPHRAAQLPLVVDFTRGHAVLFGASGWGKTTFLRSLIVSLAGTHAPDEFQVHVLDLGGRNLELLQALPHVGTIIMPDERGYEERVQQLWRKLNELLDERKRHLSEAGVSTLYEYNSQRPDQRKPAILVAIDNFAEYLATFGKATDKKDADNLLEAFVALARQGKAYGLHFIITTNRLNVLSSKLYSLFTERLTLRLADASDYSAIVGSRVEEVEEMAGRGCTRVGRMPLFFQVALPPGTVIEQGQIRREAAQIRAIGQQMMAAISRSGYRYQEPLRLDALPKSSSYRQVLAEQFGISQDERLFLGELRAAVRQQWAHTALAEHANWLRVTPGIVSGHQPRTLELEAKKDGVHGMIAGGTGSGKSELLMTLVVGLALSYSPDILNFVLVDYKGGGAFKPFERLPHCVDIVTNLNKAAVHRMFTSINAEIRRRQALNVDTGTKDIVDYRRKGLHLTHCPYPHLFIIIDEYTEMITDDNEVFRSELESITRVGRAQGINLVLASQRPKGVSDQMRANIKLRICLRVEELDASRELLHRPDAALLPSGMPGRGYVQVGNENLELIQVSYTGEPQPDPHEVLVVWPEHTRAKDGSAQEDTLKLYDAVVNLTAQLYGGKMAPKPWPGFLPRYFSLQSPLVDARLHETFVLEPAVSDWLNGDTEGRWPGVNWRDGVLRPVVGLVDDPAEARQEPLRFSLNRYHLAVFGDSGFGKTTLLRTLVVSLAATHAPDEFQAYVLDLGGRNLRSLEAFPHVGDILYADEEAFEERLQRLLEKLHRMLEERQRILSSEGATTLYEYNARHPKQALPALVVVIDNFAELQEGYESLVESVLLPLVRRSTSAGIAFVVAANVPSNLPGKLYSLFGERVTFKQVNSDRYMDIVGRVTVEIDDLPGRGYTRPGRYPLLFHVAQPVGIFDERGRDVCSEMEELRLMADQMHAYLKGRKKAHSQPEAVSILPEVVSLSRMLDEAPPTQRTRVQAVLGQDSGLQPALVDLERMGPHFAVVGPPLSGKTTTLYAWVLSLADRYAPSKVRCVLIDMQRKLFDYGGKRRLDEVPHVLMAVSELEQMERLMKNLKEEGEALAAQGPGHSEHRLFVFIDNFDDFSEEVENNRSLPRELHSLPRELASLVRKHGRDGLHMIISGVLDGTASDLRRRVQASNFGIGLRTEQAMQALKVLRTPRVRGKELPVGRGYLVKSGQPVMIQVATPYASNGLGKDGESGDEQERMALALDAWVEQIRAKYPDQQARWSSGVVTAGAPPVVLPPQNQRLEQAMRLVYRAAQQEVQGLKRGDGVDLPILEQFFAAGTNGQHDERTVTRLLQELWKKKMVAQGMPGEVIAVQASAMDMESLLLNLQDLSG